MRGFEGGKPVGVVGRLAVLDGLSGGGYGFEKARA
jgi:hypothetical protein